LPGGFWVPWGAIRADEKPRSKDLKWIDDDASSGEMIVAYMLVAFSGAISGAVITAAVIFLLMSAAAITSQSLIEVLQ
jgi:hypothetical protein